VANSIASMANSAAFVTNSIAFAAFVVAKIKLFGVIFVLKRLAADALDAFTHPW
jgi:hypothetical protein